MSSIRGSGYWSTCNTWLIITGKSDDEHLQNLENVPQRLQDNGLRANIEKCSFLQDSVVYCGHEISKEGLQKTKDKVEAVINTPALPTSRCRRNTKC
jgi:hypothetical protein